MQINLQFYIFSPPVFIICCSVLPRLLLLLTPVCLTARIMMRIAGHPSQASLHQHTHLCPQCPRSSFVAAAICVRLRISSTSTLLSNRLHSHVVLLQVIGYKEVHRTQTTIFMLSWKGPGKGTLCSFYQEEFSSVPMTFVLYTYEQCGPKYMYILDCQILIIYIMILYLI